MPKHKRRPPLEDITEFDSLTQHTIPLDGIDRNSPPETQYVNQRQIETDFIRQNIKIPKPSDSNQNIDHVDGANGDPQAVNHDGDTTNAFGEIEFKTHPDKRSKYVRLDIDTKIRKVRDLLDCWGLQEPEFILSITGGAKNIRLSRKLTDAFKRGLHKISMHTSTWIVTAGTNYGVAKFTGKAVRDCRLTRSKSKSKSKPLYAIGIATWGCVHNNELLENKTENGNYPAKYNEKGVSQRRKRYLDPHHSHFLLVDYGGAEYLPEKEIQFRAEFEKEIIKPKNDSIMAGKKIPIVLLVIEGGITALHTALKALQNGTPVLLVEGSGRVADILVFVVKNGDALEKEEMESHSGPCPFRDQVKKKLKDQLIEKDAEETYKDVMECLRYRRLIKYFNGNKIHNDIDYNILDALLLDKAHDHKSRFKLAMAWERIDVARQEKQSWFLQDRDIMSAALRLDRPHFVDFLLENGITPKEFANPDLLEEVFIKSKCEQRCKEWKTWDDIRWKLDDLLGEYAVPKYLSNLIAGENGNSDGKFRTAEACQMLFILCVLLNRQELAKLFWIKGKNGISSALIACGILNALAQETDDEEEKKVLELNVQEFNNIAINLLKLCYDKSELRTAGILNRKQTDWGGVLDNIDIAYTTRNKAFIATSACQAVFLNRWMGKIHNKTSTFMLLLSVVFPCFLFFIDFKKRRRVTCTEYTTDVYSKVPAGNNKYKYEVQPAKQRSSIKREYNCLEKVYHFYTAPIVVAAYNIISYLIFLSLFGYMLLKESSEQLIAVDILLIVWVISMTVEEIRQCFIQQGQTLKKRLSIYIRNDYNKIDILTIFLFTFGIFLRFCPVPQASSGAQIVLGLSFLIYCMRILHIFTVNKQLGPWLVMIRRMTVDLVYFFLILMVFVVSYAIAAHAIAFPNSKLDWKLAYNVLRTGYWNIYGELFLEEIEVEEPKCSYNETIYTSDPDILQCPSEIGRYIVPILRGVYVMFSNILLLNLLISVFCNTYQAVQNKANIHWSFERYEMIREYKKRPSLPAPLILLRHISMVIMWFFKRFYKLCLGCNSQRSIHKCQVCGKDCLTKQKENNDRNLMKLEKVAMVEYLERQEKEQNECIDKKVQDCIDSFEELKEKVGEIQIAQKSNEEMLQKLMEMINQQRQTAVD